MLSLAPDGSTSREELLPVPTEKRKSSAHSPEGRQETHVHVTCFRKRAEGQQLRKFVYCIPVRQ